MAILCTTIVYAEVILGGNENFIRTRELVLPGGEGENCQSI